MPNTAQGDKVEGIGTAGTPVGGVVTVQGIAGGTAFVGNITQWGGITIAAATTQSDTLGTGNILPIVMALPILLNITSGFEERARVADADAKAATGIPASGLMVYDPAGNTWNRGRSVQGGDGQSGVGMLAAGLYGLNVSSAFERLRGDATNGLKVATKRSTHTSQTNAVNTGGTLTIAAGGVGNFCYIWAIKITRVATAAVVGSAILTYTSTQLNGWSSIAGNAIAIGQTILDADEKWSTPLRSDTANTAVTIVAPAGGAATAIRIQVLFHYGPDQA